MKSKVFTYLSRAGLTPTEIMKVIDFGFMQAPASKGHHLAYAGAIGLALIAFGLIVKFTNR